MNNSNLPIIFTQVADLTRMGINAKNIKFNHTTMECDEWIAVREDKQVHMCNIKTGQVKRKSIAAEGVLMYTGNLIALRAKTAKGMALQCYEGTKKIASCILPPCTVSFWRFIDKDTIAIVKGNSVLHWNIRGGNAKPKKVFDKVESLQGCQIINYQTSADKKWLLLVGIKKVASQIVGCMMLYSVDKKKPQAIQGHTGIFAEVKVKGSQTPVTLFIFTEKKAGQKARLQVRQMPKAGDSPGLFRIKPTDIPFPADAPNDFPVSMQVSKKHDIVFMITKFGYVFLFDIHSGQALFRQRFAHDAIFATCPHSSTHGVLGITAGKGAVLSISVNEATLVPFINKVLKKASLALEISTRLGLGGADDLFVQQFEAKLSTGDIRGAAEVAARSPRGILRNADTIARFQQMAAVPGKHPPVLQYFQVLLARGKLNKLESIELCRPVVKQRKTALLTKWMQENKLEASAELGDLVAQLELKMAVKIYKDAREHDKVVQCLIQMGMVDRVLEYCTRMDHRADWIPILAALLQRGKAGADQAMAMGIKLATNAQGPLLDVNAAVDMFMQYNLLEPATKFLLEYLMPDRKEDGALQTKLLEMNLVNGAPQVADAILQQKMFSHFDQNHIAQLAERCGLFQRAAENYSSFDDVKRVILNTHQIDHGFLVKFLGDRTREECLACLQMLLQNNPQANLKIAVDVAKQYSEELRPESLIELFESFQSLDGLWCYLAAIVNASTDPEVNFKYIEVTAMRAKMMGNRPESKNLYSEVERMCRDSDNYDPERVKDFLIKFELPEPRPLIQVCDRFDYIEELTEYLYPERMKYIAVYVQKVNPGKTPKVVGKLLDLNCEQTFIQTLLNSVRNLCPVDPLVEEVERRNKLRMLEPWLEQRVNEGNQEASTHNAIGKIYITLNRNPQEWLLNNRCYDSKVIGKFCEKLDPYLAYIAYRRAWGECDDELINVTNENGLLKDQARYLVERQDVDLWAKVLQDSNEFKTQLVDEVVSTALPEADNPDMVSTTVKAFMNANLPHQLIGLLERLVLQDTIFAENRNLQNLLILTAIKAAPDRVKEFIYRLDKFDGPEIANIALGETYMLYEEAFEIYKKFDLHLKAVGVLLTYLSDLERAEEYAERCNEAEVWSALSAKQIEEGMVAKAIGGYIKADDASNYEEVIKATKADGTCYDELVQFLEMARKKIKEPDVDSQLIFALAKCDKLAELEEFVASPNVAKIQSVGDQLYDDAQWEAAKILFASISNNTKLASCFVHLGKFREAVDAAKRASSVHTWKEVNEACVASAEFRLAKTCGLHIVVNPDHLEELIDCYNKFGYFEELINLLEEGLGLDQAHPGIFSHLAILYSKHKAEKLMDHLKMFWSRMHMPRVINACEEGRHWPEAVYLYSESKDHDSAVKTMIQHSGMCFVHDNFLDCIKGVRNRELYYNAIDFYLAEHPLELAKLLLNLSDQLDHTRVVHQLAKSDSLALVLNYLKSIQKNNIEAANGAINDIYIDEEDFESLRASVMDYDNFNKIDLAIKIEKHELLEFRRIASNLYKLKERWQQSMDLSKRDQMYKDAIDTASQSKDPKLVTDLLKYFAVDQNDAQCFCACLYTCYDLVEPDVAMELAWRNQMMDYAMPFLVQYLAQTHKHMGELQDAAKPKPTEIIEDGTYMGQMAAGNFGIPEIAATAYVQPGMGGQMPMGGGQMMMGGGAPMMGGGAPMMGGGAMMMGGAAPMMGGAAPMMGGAAPMMGQGYDQAY